MGKKEKRPSYLKIANGNDQEIQITKANEPLESSDWSKEESKKLLHIVLDICKPSQQSYRASLGKVDFEKVANLLEGDKTSDDCRRHLDLLISKTSKVKTLHQIISDTIPIISNSNRREKSAYDLFWEENKDLIRSVAKQNNEKKQNVLITKAQLWKELPDEKKLFYVEKLKSPKKRVRQKQVLEGKYDNPVKSPFEIFVDKYRKKNQRSTMAEARKKYVEMDSSKKIKYIKKSIETLYLEKEALKISSELYAEKSLPKKISSHYPNHEEIKCYYHRHLELPEIPPKSLAIFAMTANGMASNNLFAINAEFHKLHNDVKQEWKIKLIQKWTNYLDQLAEWISRQDPRDIELMDKWPFLKCEKIPVKLNWESNSANTEQTKVSGGKVFKEVEMVIKNTKFNNEPSLPAMTPMAVYDNILREKGEICAKSSLRHKFNSLPEIEKVQIQERVSYVRNKYVMQIKKYVAGLPDDMRKVYLGLKRMKLINALKEDIFKEIYPDEQYPVYVERLTSSKIGDCEQNKGGSLSIKNDVLDIKPVHQSSLNSNKANTDEASASYSDELLSDSSISFESSPKKFKKRRTHKSSSASSGKNSNDFHAESSPMVKEALFSSTVLTKSSKKLIRTSSDSSSYSENEVQNKLTPEKSIKVEDSSSEEEEITEAWHSKFSFNNIY